MAPIGPGALPPMRSRRGGGRMRRPQTEKAIAARDRATVRRGGEPAARGGKLCVRACAGTAPSPAGAETRRVGDSAPLSGVVKFHGGDPTDRPPRGRHGGGDNRPRLTVDSVFVVGVRMGGAKTARE